MLGRYVHCPECGSDALDDELQEGLVPFTRCLRCGFEESALDGEDEDGILHPA